MSSEKAPKMAPQIRPVQAREFTGVKRSDDAKCHVSELDDELAAMWTIAELLAARSVEARGRILRWLTDRWKAKDVVCVERHGQLVAGSLANSG
ncbi:hypothetical protein [Streptosporangium saharense]|uniref:hypothetical protein n=1 Tax=Streptosporangium saharense TaxID=1706840 RepID=UPI003322EBA4